MIMTLQELTELFQKSSKRYHMIGTEAAGVVAGLDQEGRLFTVFEGRILNRVNAHAISGTSTREGYLNPGGDGLWPAPEGSRLGYEYSTGKWRVPPSLSGARYWVTDSGTQHATIRAEIDLVNDQMLGVPTAFERRIRIEAHDKTVAVVVEERIEYLGNRTLSSAECLLAPWSLCQFDCAHGCEVIFPLPASEDCWDLYDPSDDQRYLDGDLWHTRTDATKRYQIGLAPSVPWIEYIDPRHSLTVRRTTEELPAGQAHIDITDRPPEEEPAARGIRFSVYSDPAGFMEIEAAGGCPEQITPGTVMAVKVSTTYRREMPLGA